MWRSTDRMSDEAATLVLHFWEDGARHQTRSGAAQDHICAHETLGFVEDLLLDFELLKDTFLKEIIWHVINVYKRTWSDFETCLWLFDQVKNIQSRKYINATHPIKHGIKPFTSQVTMGLLIARWSSRPHWQAEWDMHDNRLFCSSRTLFGWCRYHAKTCSSGLWVSPFNHRFF